MGFVSVSAAGVVGNTDFDFTDATAFRNNFDRVAAYLSYSVGARTSFPWWDTKSGVITHVLPSDAS